MFDDFCDSDGLSSNYCGNERRKTACIHTTDALIYRLSYCFAVQKIIETNYYCRNDIIRARVEY